MTIIYPEPRSIVQVGSVDIQVGLTSRSSFLNEYGIIMRMDRDKFFKDFRYCLNVNGRVEALDLVTSQEWSTLPMPTFINKTSIGVAMNDPENAHFQLGAKYTAMRYAFPLTCKELSLPLLNGNVGGYRTMQGNAYVHLYAAFFDHRGYPVNHWFHPDDAPDQISVLYEYFGDGNDTFMSSFEVTDKLERTFGLAPGTINTNDPSFPETLVNVVSGPLTVLSGNTEPNVTFDNAVMLQSSLPRVKGIPTLPKGTLPNVYYEDTRPIAMTPFTDGSTTSTRVNLVRASALGITTLVFASIKDDLTSKMGLTDTVAIMLYRPSNASIPSGLSLKAIAPEFVFPDTPVPNTDISFKDTLMVDPVNTYVSRKLTTNAATMHFPALTTSPSGVLINIVNLHKAMPDAPLGHRMLQLFSAAADSATVSADGMEDLLPQHVRTLLDIRQGLGKRLDLSKEPVDTHNIILQNTEAYLMDAMNRNTFIAEFTQKFPGVLESYASMVPRGTPCLVNDAIVASSQDISLVINTNVSFETSTNVTKIEDIPLVFQLTK